MVKSLEFWDVMSDALGVERSSVDRVARSLRAAELIATGAGRHSADITPREAARYLIAFLGSGKSAHAAEAVARFGTLPADPSSEGLECVCKVLRLRRRHTFCDALESLLARLPDLMAADAEGDVGLWWVTVNERRKSATITIGGEVVEYFDPRPLQAMRRNAAARAKALEAGDLRAVQASIEADQLAMIEADMGRHGLRVERTATQYELAPIAEGLRR